MIMLVGCDDDDDDYNDRYSKVECHWFCCTFACPRTRGSSSEVYVPLEYCWGLTVSTERALIGGSGIRTPLGPLFAVQYIRLCYRIIYRFVRILIRICSVKVFALFTLKILHRWLGRNR